jgi:hypothetical protein
MLASRHTDTDADTEMDTGSQDMDTEDRHVRITLRMPKELHARLQAEADNKTRSMNAEIVARLEQSFGPAARSADVAQLHNRIALLEERLKGHHTTIAASALMIEHFAGVFETLLRNPQVRAAAEERQKDAETLPEKLKDVAALMHRMLREESADSR